MVVPRRKTICSYCENINISVENGCCVWESVDACAEIFSGVLEIAVADAPGNVCKALFAYSDSAKAFSPSNFGHQKRKP